MLTVEKSLSADGGGIPCNVAYHGRQSRLTQNGYHGHWWEIKIGGTLLLWGMRDINKKAPAPAPWTFQERQTADKHVGSSHFPTVQKAGGLHQFIQEPQMDEERFRHYFRPSISQFDICPKSNQHPVCLCRCGRRQKLTFWNFWM